MDQQSVIHPYNKVLLRNEENKLLICDGEGNGKPLQYSCLENPIDRGAWWVTVHGVAESDTTELTSTDGAYLIV